MEMKNIIKISPLLVLLGLSAHEAKAEDTPQTAQGAVTLNDAAKALDERAKAGDASAQFDLGVLYQTGQQGGAPDQAKALELFQQSANAGHAPALFNLASVYYNGDGVAKDEAKAITLYKQALEAYRTLASNGDAQAATMVDRITTMLNQANPGSVPDNAGAGQAPAQ
jgi:TPR repeat protein